MLEICRNGRRYPLLSCTSTPVFDRAGAPPSKIPYAFLAKAFRGPACPRSLEPVLCLAVVWLKTERHHMQRPIRVKR
jgi:hypothetical protein